MVKGKAMQYETEIALANLDWLIYNRDMRLDYGARAVLYVNGEPGYLLADLEVPGLTPATAGWQGRGPTAMCTAASLCASTGRQRTRSGTWQCPSSVGRCTSTRNLSPSSGPGLCRAHRARCVWPYRADTDWTIL